MLSEALSVNTTTQTGQDREGTSEMNNKSSGPAFTSRVWDAVVVS